MPDPQANVNTEFTVLNDQGEFEGDGEDVLVGVNVGDQSPGSGEIDTLTGGAVVLA